MPLTAALIQNKEGSSGQHLHVTTESTHSNDGLQAGCYLVGDKLGVTDICVLRTARVTQEAAVLSQMQTPM